MILHFLLFAIFSKAVIVTSQNDNLCGTNNGQAVFRSTDGKKGIFASPGYPTNYPANLNCKFRFRAQPGEVVWIEWDSFILEQPMHRNNQCLHDYIEIIVTDYKNIIHITERYCGDRKPPDLKTMQTTVDILFHTSHSKHYQGFKGRYSFFDEKFVPPPMSKLPVGHTELLTKQCGGIAGGNNQHNGTIISPGYPDTYPANVECYWLIRVDRGKRIDVKVLGLNLSGNLECHKASVQIYDGYKHDVNSFDSTRFCGDETYYTGQGQKSYLSHRNRVLVKFVTRDLPDSIKQSRAGKPIGFRLLWTEIENADNDDVCLDGFLCHGGKTCIDEKQNICAKRQQYCIAKSLVCNGLPNCLDGDKSDEQNCTAISAATMVHRLYFLVVLYSFVAMII